ncbi:CBY1-interacting BAR domain-containing protein 1 isoform X2 [Oncorhynchus nerka]|uniref:CBY1-interacting BAR domain-containing protein 1 isoform X2 n=1 Tax=Oncorhynchus nerka TaxID=8023 RepID=UPI0031B8AB9E
MSRTPDARARDSQTRQIQENITNTEKHFGEMCQLFAAYVRKTARLRDKADLLVREISIYAETETPNLQRGMKQFADNLAKVQDYRQAEEDLKTSQSARNRESKQMQQLERMRQRNPSDRQIISQVGVCLLRPLELWCCMVAAESDLQRATMDATRTTRQLEETIDAFEKQKIQDIKKIFGEFLTVEMSFHAKALEAYTTAYQSIHNVDEEGDLEVFRSLLHPPDYQSRLEIVRANSKTSLNLTASTLCKTGTLQQSLTPSRQRREEEEGDDEDVDDEEEDDDLEEVTDDE